VVLFDLLVNILGHDLSGPAYEAEVAQLEYKLRAGEHGLELTVKGFNHKLPVSLTHTHTHIHVMMMMMMMMKVPVSPAAVPPDRGPPGQLLLVSRCVQHVL